MEIKVMSEDENRRFSQLVIGEFMEWFMLHGVFPDTVGYYRICRFYKQEGTTFYYLYPQTLTERHLYKLSVPQELIHRAIQINQTIDVLKQDVEKFKDKIEVGTVG